MEPSPEVKAMIQEFVRINREKYGENWKDILAKEMTDKMLDSPIMQEITKRLTK